MPAGSNHGWHSRNIRFSKGRRDRRPEHARTSGVTIPGSGSSSFNGNRAVCLTTGSSTLRSYSLAYALAVAVAMFVAVGFWFFGMCWADERDAARRVGAKARFGLITASDRAALSFTLKVYFCSASQCESAACNLFVSWAPPLTSPSLSSRAGQRPS